MVPIPGTPGGFTVPPELTQSTKVISQLDEALKIIADVTSGKTSLSALNKIILDAVKAGKTDQVKMLEQTRQALTTRTVGKVGAAGEKGVTSIAGSKSEDAATEARKARMNALDQQGITLDKEKLGLKIIQQLP